MEQGLETDCLCLNSSSAIYSCVSLGTSLQLSGDSNSKIIRLLRLSNY